MIFIEHVVRWKRRLALLLMVVMICDLGTISSSASVYDNVDTRVMIQRVVELPDEIRTQQTKLGTAEEALNLPKFLTVATEVTETESYEVAATTSEGVKKYATSSDSTKDIWEQVPVTWGFVSADNGLTSYDGEVPGIYTFKAQLADEHYEIKDELLPLVTVEVKEEVISEGFMDGFIDLGTIETSVATSFFGLENITVDLREGNFEKWIDRIDVPDYARSFYKTMEEYTDNDGNNDQLIEDRYLSKENAFKNQNYVFNGIAFATLSRESLLEDDEWSYICECIWASASAFDRDHPEVFWLQGGGMMYWTCDTTRENQKTIYNYTLYYMFKVHEGREYTDFDIRYKEYRNEASIKGMIRKRDQWISRIMGTTSSEDVVDKIIAYNDWLTKNNAYNTTYPNLDNAPRSAWKCISALEGNIREKGPVCEGYARAFKVLCDKAKIPCVLVDGLTYGDPDGAHMWNYAKVDDEWYAVDVTWDDPFVSSGVAVSGHENTNWLLLGSETMVDNNTVTFIESHPVNNNPGTVKFTNGPELSKERLPLVVPTVRFSETQKTKTMVYTGKPAQIDPPTVSLEDGTLIENPVITYSYKIDGATTYTNGLPVDAGNYVVKARAVTSKEKGYRGADSINTVAVTIEKASRSIEPVTVSEQTDVSITLNPPVLSAGGNDGTVEYAYSLDGSVPSGGWQKNPVITGLNRNTRYYLFARVTGGRNYKDVTGTVGTAWKTDKTKVARPTLKKAQYTYTGGTVTAELNDFDGSIMGISGNTGVNQGNYRLEVTIISEDFVWSDGTSLPVSLDWKIMLGRTLPAPKGENVTNRRVVLKAVLPDPSASAEDGILEYGYALENDSSKVENWQTGTTFDNLENGTVYYFFARMTGGTKYIDIVSASTALTPKKKSSNSNPDPIPKPDYIYEGTWEQNGTVWYLRQSNGNLVKDNWARIDGKWYRFDNDGIMLTGWQKIENQWYYLGSDGIEGAMATGWLLDNNKWYYLDGSGAMAVGWREVNNRRYYLDSDGAMAVGWRLVDSKWYYLSIPDGAMYASTVTPDGYEVNKDGAWVKDGVVQVQ